MTLSYVIFVVLVFGLPIAVSFRLFRNAPERRPFLATYVLAVMGSTISFGLFALLLTVLQIGGLGPFDGIFAIIVAVPVALIVGLIVRHERKSMPS